MLEAQKSKSLRLYELPTRVAGLLQRRCLNHLYEGFNLGSRGTLTPGDSSAK
jgi:hypothetical protein